MTLFLKFVHVLCAITLLGTTFFCIVSSAQGLMNLKKINNWLGFLGIIAIISGAFLVYPKQFTFHTPWIKAAFIFGFIYLIGLFILNRINFQNKKVVFLSYLALVCILIVIIHDAVTKTTFLI